jgi:prepilin-type N-terminal cleavage/methylation domain-containing protein
MMRGFSARRKSEQGAASGPIGPRGAATGGWRAARVPALDVVRGFTLVEVLVALVVLLIGAYVVMRIFPVGFQAIERARLESVASRLADQEIQRWQLAAGSLPEAIVWADSSSGSLVYNVTYDPSNLTPDEVNPNWEPDSAYFPRTIIGEVLPVGDITASVADPNGVDPDAIGVRVPLCRLRFGPLEHLYDSPAAGDPLFIYTTKYERVDRPDFLSGAKDWGRYYIDNEVGTISFDYADYDRRFRVEFAYLTSGGLGTPEERRFEMSQTVQMINVPAGWDSRPSGVAAGQGPIALLPETSAIEASPAGAVRSGNVVTITTTAAHGFAVGQKIVVSGVVSVGGTDFNGTFTITGVPTATTFTYSQAAVDDTGGGGTVGPLPGNFRGVVPLSERVHQAFILDTDDWPINGPGYFKLIGATSNPIDDSAAYLLFDPGDAGRTVNVDYRVRDWQIMLEERVPDSSLQIRLSVPPVKSADYTNPPRQPARDRILPDVAGLPGKDEMVIILDTQDGSRILPADFTVDYRTGLIGLSGPAQPGHTYRVYYRSVQDWTVQPMKAASDYSIMVGDTAQPGYRFAVWDTPTAPQNLDFGRSEVAKSVVANYYMYTDPPANMRPKLIAGEMHQVALQGNQGLIQLDHAPAWGDIRVRGASMRARVLWAGRGTVTAAGGTTSPESWRQAVVETFLRRQ